MPQTATCWNYFSYAWTRFEAQEGWPKVFLRWESFANALELTLGHSNTTTWIIYLSMSQTATCWNHFSYAWTHFEAQEGWPKVFLHWESFANALELTLGHNNTTTWIIYLSMSQTATCWNCFSYAWTRFETAQLIIMVPNRFCAGRISPMHRTRFGLQAQQQQQ